MKLIANSCLSLFFSLLFLSTFAHSSENKSSFEFRTMQRVRIDFESPNGYVRPLLLGFTTDNAATDGVDYGYDGSNFDQFPDDLFWVIEDNNYVIQGVGEFEETKQYPLAMYIENSGTIKITLNSLENFNTDIAVYVYDSLLDTYTAINDSSFNIEMADGEYINRFFITFEDPNLIGNDQNNTTLSVTENTFNETTIIQFLGYSKVIHVKLSDQNSSSIKEIELYNTNGQLVNSFTYKNNKNMINIPLDQLNYKHLIVRVVTQDNSQRKLLAIY